DIHNHSFIETTGDFSVGIKAQSLGGGGGDGGYGVVGTKGLIPGVPIDLTTFLIPIETTGTLEGLGVVTIGGFGGSAGDGNTVTVINDGSISTLGQDAHGI